MKKIKKTFFIAIATIGLIASTNAQSKEGSLEVKYRRSSLHTILVETDYFPRKETVIKAYNKAPFPNNYNDHTISAESFDPKKYPVLASERSERDQKNHEAAAQMASSFNIAAATKGIIDPDANDLPISINKFFNDAKVANLLVAKWYNRKPDGSFDMDLIGSRGFYNASEMEANIGKSSARGLASISDAGEELINNTFVVVSKLNFISNEIAAAKIRDLAKDAAAKIGNEFFKKLALDAADKTYQKTKEGYSVLTTSFLYQLVWNDSIAAVFYNDLWMDKNKIDPKKKEAFDNTHLFKLKYIGTEGSVSIVLFSLKEKRTEDQIIELATIRNVDAVFAKLQKKYDVFKPKVPLYTGNPITAKIGMKEGLEGGEKFEVFEQTIDEKTGLTKYVSKGKITVDKNLIWDNRYNASDGPAELPSTVGEASKPVLDRTTFKGGKDYYSGMLIRQIK
ncbi:MAG: hypothetical protein HXX14_05285 [Bacteroidetes bacterium]|nr:hypothetical protein [Bacteroidota bacterium]